MQSARESYADIFLGVAIGALLRGGHSPRSARSYLERRGWIESDDPDEAVDVPVRGAIAAITTVLGAEVDVVAFVVREAVWRAFENGAFEEHTRAVFSREASQLILRDVKRAARPRLRLVGRTMEC